MGKFFGWLLAILIIAGGGAYYYYTKTGYKFGLDNSFLFKGSIPVSSLDFTDGGIIPVKFTCDGDDVSPQFTLTKLPTDTKSVAMILEDESTKPISFTHWLVFNFSSDFNIIDSSTAWQNGVVGINDFGNKEYNGPCPTDGQTHKYSFIVYALNTTITSVTQNRVSFDKIITGHILATGSITGTYSKKP